MIKNIISDSKYNLFKELNKTFSDSKNKSLTKILEEYRCTSQEFSKFKEEQKNENNYHYSSIFYSELNSEEKDYFDNNSLYNVNNLILNSIYDHNGIVWNWKDVYKLMQDKSYATVEKINRKVSYSTETNIRPTGNSSYDIWNGFQVIDLDIKNFEIADKLKPILFKDLSKYHWFLGICKSASMKGLHIWTKINPISVNQDNKKVEYILNFRHKYSYVYLVLLSHMNEIGYTKNNIIDYIDMAMCKPAQGSFISSDSNAYISTNFKPLRLDIDFEKAFKSNVEDIDWISHPDLKEVFSKLEWFNNDDFNQQNNIEIANIENINERDDSKNIRKHYKHAQRWQLANTLNALYGANKALIYMLDICTGTDKRELYADIKTASIHNKPVSKWAIEELNKYHGFKIVDKTEREEVDENKKLMEEIEESEDKDFVKIYSKKNQILLNIDSTQYLSDIQDEIISNLSHITLLEAGAGYGKTEMIKGLKSKTLLILPFTSTIKAKVESDEKTADWLYFYGKSKPTLEDLFGKHSMTMTIDKFSKLNVMEIDQADFKYIVIDESHLLFTSSYRDVMSPTIQRLANCKAKVIMMSGTPTGEKIFFPDIKHIKVIKEDKRIKRFNLYMCYREEEQLIEMAKQMAIDILSGVKILHPTNKGNLYYEQLIGIIQEYINKSEHPREINTFYYKKSNYGEEIMEKINRDKDIGDSDIIFCSTYLSVGVDICNKYKFSIYFNEEWIPQDIEQFANRVRNNDLYVKMFLRKEKRNPQTGEYERINYNYFENLDLGYSQDELIKAKDLLNTVNDMIERNQEESKYNPLIQSLLASNKYLKYDENDCRYYIDETTYKLNKFEEGYSKFSKQLKVMLQGIKYYGYEIITEDIPNIIKDEEREEKRAYLLSLKNSKYNRDTIEVNNLLSHINENNIDLYKEILKGNYALFKDEKYKEDRINNDIYVPDIELLEKNIPLIISFYKYYDSDTVKDIYHYCTDSKSNRINYSKLIRIKKFISIESSRKKKRLDFPAMKLLQDFQLYASEHPETTKDQIEDFLKNWTVKYVNSIKYLIIEDVDYLKEIYELVKEYWKVIIDQGRPHKNIIKIKPVYLFWKYKEELNNIYGDIMTQHFFAEELVEEMKETEEDENEEELPEFELTKKYKIKDIESEIPNIIHSPFDYFDYSEKDGSNDRFLRKQKNTKKSNDMFVSNSYTTAKKKEEENKIQLEIPF